MRGSRSNQERRCDQIYRCEMNDITRTPAVKLSLKHRFGAGNGQLRARVGDLAHEPQERRGFDGLWYKHHAARKVGLGRLHHARDQYDAGARAFLAHPTRQLKAIHPARHGHVADDGANPALGNARLSFLAGRCFDESKPDCPRISVT